MEAAVIAEIGWRMYGLFPTAAFPMVDFPSPIRSCNSYWKFGHERPASYSSKADCLAAATVDRSGDRKDVMRDPRLMHWGGITLVYTLVFINYYFSFIIKPLSNIQYYITTFIH